MFNKNRLFIVCSLALLLTACSNSNLTNINSSQTNVQETETTVLQTSVKVTNEDMQNRQSPSFKETTVEFADANTKPKQIKVKLNLIDGWTLKKEEVKPTYLASHGVSHYSVYGPNGELQLGLSYIGYDKEYDNIPEPEQRQKAYYSGVRLGSTYFCILYDEEVEQQFAAKPEIISDTDTREVILCKYYNSTRKQDGKTPNDEIDINPAALIRYKQKHFYIIIECIKTIDQSILRNLVESIQLVE